MQQPGRTVPAHIQFPWTPASLLLGALAASSGAGATAVGRVAAEFGVDPVGAATYVVPIGVAAGRGGLRPEIGFRYASHDGDGLAGVGFSVTGLSRVTRCPLTIAVDGRTQGVRFSAGDRFCLDGQPLVLVAGTYGADGAEYRTEVNNLKRVISRGRQASGPASFEVHHPDGLTWRYGNDPDSRLEAVGAAGEIREWAINQVSDKFSNQISYTWLDDQVGGEALPAEISWSNDASGSGARLRLVFGYEARPAEDQRQMHRWGTTWQRFQRLSSIRYEAVGGGGFGLVHRYTLTYAPAGAAAGSRASNSAGRPSACRQPPSAGRLAWPDSKPPLPDRPILWLRIASSPITTVTGMRISMSRSPWVAPRAGTSAWPAQQRPEPTPGLR